MSQAVPILLIVLVAGALAVAVYTVLAPSSGRRLLAGLNDENFPPPPPPPDHMGHQEYIQATSEQLRPGETSQTRAAVTAGIRHALESTLGRRLDRSNRGPELALGLMRADLKLRPAEWVMMVGIAGFGIGVLGAVRFDSLLAFPIGFLIAYIASRLALRFLQSRRRKHFDEQLSPMILTLSNGLKAGHSFAQAIDLAGKNSIAPIGPELVRVVREVQLGVPIGESLAKMVVRNESEDLRLMTTAVHIQTQVGGNLAQILDTIEYTIRERIRIKGEIRTLTSQARASGWILIILPFALAGILSMVAPSYFNPMLKETAGQVMIGIALFSLFCGWMIIRKIVDIKV